MYFSPQLESSIHHVVLKMISKVTHFPCYFKEIFLADQCLLIIYSIGKLMRNIYLHVYETEHFDIIAPITVSYFLNHLF